MPIDDYFRLVLRFISGKFNSKLQDTQAKIPNLCSINLLVLGFYNEALKIEVF